MKTEIAIGNYFITSKIGKGSFSKVYKGYHKDTKIRYAVKVIKTSKIAAKLLDSLYNEINILTKINHPNIVKLHDSIKTIDCIYLFLDYCENGDLYNHILSNEKFKEEEALDIFIQISKGLNYLWKNNLIHRDLKPHNILLTTTGLIKIADFGFAKYAEETTLMNTLCGSPIYMAPEILKYKKYDASVDLWSMGVILFEMLTGNHPFTGRNHIDLLYNIENTAFKISKDILLTSKCVTMLQSLLVVNPKKRITFYDFFIHPFFEGFEFNKEAKINFVLISNNDLTLSIQRNEIPKKPPEDLYNQELITGFVLLTKRNTEVKNKVIDMIIAIQYYLEIIYKCTSEIVFFGNTQENEGNISVSLPLYIKSMDLYSHGLEVCNNTIKDTAESEQYLLPIKKLLIEKFSYVLDKTEKIYSVLKDITFKLITAEELIYKHALMKAREAASLEILEEYTSAINEYVIAFRLFSSLTHDKIPLNKHDSKIVDNYIQNIIKRLNELKIF